MGLAGRHQQKLDRCICSQKKLTKIGHRRGASSGRLTFCAIPLAKNGSLETSPSKFVSQCRPILESLLSEQLQIGCRDLIIARANDPPKLGVRC
jgi:hypothetical protein